MCQVCQVCQKWPESVGLPNALELNISFVVSLIRSRRLTAARTAPQATAIYYALKPAAAEALGPGDLEAKFGEV